MRNLSSLISDSSLRRHCLLNKDAMQANETCLKFLLTLFELHLDGLVMGQFQKQMGIF